MNLEIKSNIEKIFYLYKLKKVLRWGSDEVEVNTESVAEHIFGMMILINHFLPIIDAEKKMDSKKIYDLALFHDIDEIETGDIITYNKTQDDIDEAKKTLTKIFKNTPDTFLKKMKDSYDEYENNESQESKFVKVIDKIEAVFHAAFDYATFERGFEQISLKLSDIKKDKLEKTKSIPEIQEYIEPLFDIIKKNNEKIK